MQPQISNFVHSDNFSGHHGSIDSMAGGVQVARIHFAMILYEEAFLIWCLLFFPALLVVSSSFVATG
jgi:hypothetical protein